MVITLLPISGYYSIKNNRIQNYLAQKLAASFSKKINHKISFGTIHFSLFNKLNLSEILILDQNDDTLFYIPKLSLNIKQANRKERILRFSSIIVDHGVINFLEDTTGTLNIKRFAEALKSKKKGGNKQKWQVYITHLRMNDMRFTLQKYQPVEKPGINFTALQLSDMNFRAKNFNIINDSISTHIKNLSFTDISGFGIDNFTAFMGISSKGMDYSEGAFTTPNHTNLFFETIRLSYNGYNQLSADSFPDKVKLNIQFRPSTLSYQDISFFAKGIKGQKEIITYAGKIYGTLSDLKMRNMEVSLGSKTTFKGKVDMNGLPDFNHTFLFIDIDHFATTVFDINTLFLSSKLNEKELPPAIYESGLIQYKGKFTGFMDDFVSYGIIFTDLGIISTDLLIKPDTAKYVGFKGNIKAHNFDIGKFTGQQEKLGKISLIANIKGSSSKENKLFADLEGKIISFEVMGYAYKNIEMNGRLSDKFFDGSVTINDPNLNFEFTGEMDFSSEIPIFNFTAQLHHADMYKLHLIQTDSVYTISCLVTADFSGDNMDALDGKISLVNSIFEKTCKRLEISNLSLIAGQKDNKDRLDLTSDFVNGNITGEYDFSKLSHAIKCLAHRYLPSLGKEDIAPLDTGFNNFSYHFDCGNTRAFCDFFFPGFCMAEGSYFYGDLISEKNSFTLFCVSPEITTAGKLWNNFQMSIISSDSVFSINSGCESFTLAENYHLENFTIISDIVHDNIYFNARWNNWDTLVNKGNIFARAKFLRSNISTKPSIDFYIQPSYIVFGNTQWQIHESTVRYDSSYLAVNRIRLTNNEREIELNGQLSGNSDDKLKVEIRNFNMASINLFSSTKGLFFEGNLNGNAIISDIFSNPVINSNFAIDSLLLNHERLGMTLIQTKWDNTKKIIDVNAQIKRGKINTLDITGTYQPESKEMAFDIHLDKLKMNILKPYLSSTFSNINGAASGDLRLEGKGRYPVMNGSIVVQKAAFTVNYLNTYYYFADLITIENNNVFFKNIELHDYLGNKALLNGKISTKYLKDISVNLNLETTNFCLLNTNSNDNDQFYGKAFATGKISIDGPPRDIYIKANIKTEKNTEFSMPLSSGNEVYETTFITWSAVQKDTTINNRNTKYQVNLSGVTLDFDLEVTPDAEAQLIFDPKVGDVIKSKGSGNLKLNINTLGKFQIYGDYYIEEGDYLLTVGNVINKKFKVERGSSIVWNGDPNDADINVKAVYRLKTSTANLTQSVEEKSGYRVPVECRVLLTNRLMNPTIKFDISMPSVDEETKTALRNATSTDEDLSKQFLSLLVLNNFMIERTNTDMKGSTENINPKSNVAGVTTSELLSNQLSHWLSQISNDVDIGVNYRPGDEITSDEVELALSTQVLNDRVSIAGNLDVGGNQADAANTTTNNIMGDFDVDVKITQSGKLRVKAFNRANDKLLYEKSPYTQGVGLFYREEFDTFGNLVKRYWNKLFGD